MASLGIPAIKESAISLPWSTPFEEPVSTSTGRALVTLEDAARYIQKLPKAEQHQAHWQTAVEHLIRAAETGGGWLMLARIGMMRALNRGAPAPTALPAKQYRIISVPKRKKGPAAQKGRRGH
jgi:hypothetical protein